MDISKSPYTFQQNRLLLSLLYMDQEYLLIVKEIKEINSKNRMEQSKTVNDQMQTKDEKVGTHYIENQKLKNQEAPTAKKDIFQFEKKNNKSIQKIIKKKFRQISKLIHPDKTSDTKKHDSFKKIKESTSNGFIYTIYITSIIFNIEMELTDEIYKILQLEHTHLGVQLKNMRQLLKTKST